MCIESMDYPVIVYNEPVGPIILGRGLRQRDPLSLYLFNLCAEGLSSLIRDAENRNTIFGTRICRGAPTISHFYLLMIVFFLSRTMKKKLKS